MCLRLGPAPIDTMVDMYVYGLAQLRQTQWLIDSAHKLLVSSSLRYFFPGRSGLRSRLLSRVGCRVGDIGQKSVVGWAIFVESRLLGGQYLSKVGCWVGSICQK